MTTNTKISNLVATQVPFFVRNDHENFVRFLEAYYEYLEQEGKVVERAMNLPSYYDVDQSIDQFVQKFYDQYLPLIPEDVLVDKTLILKRIKDFYRARGTEKSINFLLRILFNEDAQFYYPQRDILRASDGKWFIDKSLKIFNLAVDGVANSDIGLLNKFAGRRITGVSSNNYAIVESADSYYETGTLVQELKISNQYKEFAAGETITATFDENGQQRILTANIGSGIINSVQITNPGTGYQVGDVVQIESNEGTGGSIIVSSVSTGNVSSLALLFGGAGFAEDDDIDIVGGGGAGASAKVVSVDKDGSEHPNTYQIMLTSVADYLNVALDSETFGFTADPNANVNTVIANAMSSWTYANTGPITGVVLLTSGAGYTSSPTVSARANSRITNLGILGRLRIVSGGLNYVKGQKIYFDNPIGSYGIGAVANINNVAANGMITSVYFESANNLPAGGVGYNNNILPTANLSATSGTGANVVVLSTLGDGENLFAAASQAGAILELQILSRGLNYVEPPTLNLQSIGDGTATANAEIIAGVFTYPGRYLNDDGHLSSYNFIQDRDYYQPFSYVIKIKQSIEKYRKALKDLVHPAGMKMFGEYVTVDEGVSANLEIIDVIANYSNGTFRGTFTAAGNGTNSTVTVSTSRYVSNGRYYIEFASSNNASLNTGAYDRIYTANVITENTSFRVSFANSINATGTVYFSSI